MSAKDVSDESDDDKHESSELKPTLDQKVSKYVIELLKSTEIRTSPWETETVADTYVLSDVEQYYAIELRGLHDMCRHCRCGEGYSFLLKLCDGNYGILEGWSGCLTENAVCKLYVASDLEILADLVKDKSISTLDLKHAIDPPTTTD